MTKPKYIVIDCHRPWIYKAFNEEACIEMVYFIIGTGHDVHVVDLERQTA